MQNSIIIALDGFAGCGKSSTAKAVAKCMAYRYLDTGAMYRAVTFYFLEKNVNIHEVEAVNNALAQISLNFQDHAEHGLNAMFLNGVCIEHEIRSMRVSDNVSEVSTISAVRSFLVKQQKEIGKGKGLVADGRDVGTVIFPGAELKVFMSASMEARAIRRRAELLAKGSDVSVNQIIENLQKRDAIDTQRADSPLRQAEDAILLDTSDLNFDEQVQKIVDMAQSKIKSIAQKNLRGLLI
ncbi:MAG: (d)CMP kinase [Cytophagales bacterium]|nr:MAG: (d)CMP kinase [Cytophagales bacterium]TAF60238.1 MAG: (d)CMP kinase [Cytophagales bacterium]